MTIQFLINLFTTRLNPKMPTMTAPVDGPRPLVIKLDAKHYRLDTYNEGLIAQGYQVVRGASLKEGIKLARRVHPDVIITFDNPRANLDAKDWLDIQHSDLEAPLAMIPLLIVAEHRRAEQLKVHELPGRVQVLMQPVEIETLLMAVKNLLILSNF